MYVLHIDVMYNLKIIIIRLWNVFIKYCAMYFFIVFIRSVAYFCIDVHLKYYSNYSQWSVSMCDSEHNNKLWIIFENILRTSVGSS